MNWYIGAAHIERTRDRWRATYDTDPATDREFKNKMLFVLRGFWSAVNVVVYGGGLFLGLELLNGP